MKCLQFIGQNKYLRLFNHRKMGKCFHVSFDKFSKVIDLYLFHVTYTCSMYYIKWVGRVWVHLLGGQGIRDRFIIILHERIWKAPAVLLFLLVFDDTGSLGGLSTWLPPWVIGRLSQNPLVSVYFYFSCLSSSLKPPAIQCL